MWSVRLFELIGICEALGVQIGEGRETRHANDTRRSRTSDYASDGGGEVGLVRGFEDGSFGFRCRAEGYPQMKNATPARAPATPVTDVR
jgi:hypothetical protein